MKAALVFTRSGGEQRFELSGRVVTIGRGADCELQLADDRISTRHCRISPLGGDWQIEDLKSTNRTFLNDEPLGAYPRALRHGDLVRLGALDARLFEARFVVPGRGDEAGDDRRDERRDSRDDERRDDRRDDRGEAHRAAARSVADGVQRELAELRVQLAGRNDEVARLAALAKRQQAQLLEGDTASAAARRASAMMTAELDELRSQLAVERTEHAASRDELERLRRRCAELEADAAAQSRKARRELDDGDRARGDLESRLRLTSSELAAAKAALATATDNVRALQQAHDDALRRLDGLDVARRTL